MKVQITCDNFPMSLIDMMVEDLKKYLDTYDVQIGGSDTVYVTFCSEDISKIQCGCIVVDKFRYGHGLEGDTDGG